MCLERRAYLKQCQVVLEGDVVETGFNVDSFDGDDLLLRIRNDQVVHAYRNPEVRSIGIWTVEKGEFDYRCTVKTLPVAFDITLGVRKMLPLRPIGYCR